MAKAAAVATGQVERTTIEKEIIDRPTDVTGEPIPGDVFAFMAELPVDKASRCPCHVVAIA